MAKLFPAPGGGGGGGAPLTTTEPAALGTAAAGSSVEAARADHVHAMPTAAQVGARDSSWVPTAAQVGALASTWTPPAQLPTPPMDGAVETMNRVTVGDSSANLLVSGRLYFTFFTALASITATKFKIQSTGTAAASITLARLGLYTAPNADGSGMTCVAACANTTSLLSSTFTEYTPAFATNTVGGTAMPTSYNLVQGTRYAVGIIFVGTTMPRLYGNSYMPSFAFQPPRMCGSLASQSDLVLNPGALSNTPTGTAYVALTT